MMTGILKRPVGGLFGSNNHWRLRNLQFRHLGGSAAVRSVLAPDGGRDSVNGTGKVVWKEALLGTRFL